MPYATVRRAAVAFSPRFAWRGQSPAGVTHVRTRAIELRLVVRQ